MAKFYIESGELRTIIEDRYAIRAAAKALALAEGMRLDSQVMVNERGFISDRQNSHPHPGDMVLETGTLLAMMAEHALA